MILDTCALLWLAEGSRKISRPTFRTLQSADVILVPSVTAFEIARKVYDGDLELPLPLEEWFDQVVHKHGLTELPLDRKTCLRAAGFPAIHADPIDRFIIAAAKIQQCEVVTSDERFPEYGITTLI